MKNYVNQSIEELIIKILQEGPLATVELVGKISTVREGTTKQGVYRVLRKLNSEEKIVIYGKTVSLNVNWLKTSSEFFSLALYYYSPKLISNDSFLNIREKDKVVYYFKNLNLLDSFGSHVFNMFAEILNPKEVIFVYNPHAWFSYARQESEQALIKILSERNKQVLITVGNDFPLDRELKKQFKNDLVQYHITDKIISEKPNYYFNIFGDYIIELFIDQKIEMQVDKFFKETRIFDEKAKRELTGIISSEGKNKLIITRSHNKAGKYKKILAKNFYIKK